jgi:DNA-binding SARP family transcriptional activator
VSVEFRILGPLEALLDGVPAALGGPRQRAVLAILLAHANEVVPADRLIDGVWDDDPPETAANVLQGYVSHLRRALGREVIATRGRDYAIRVTDGALDLHRYERLAGAAATARAEGRARDASAALRDALALWRGPALSDLTELVSTRRIAARLNELRTAALERRIEADLACGHEADAVAELEALVVEHPLRERFRALHMLALYRGGRQADALESYRAARATLVDELGIEPGRELQELERAILAQDPALAPPSGPNDRGAAVRPRPATIIVAALVAESLESLTAVAEPLARGTDSELVLATTVAGADRLAAATERLGAMRAGLAARGVTARVAAFTSLHPGADLARLAVEQEAGVLLSDAPGDLLEDTRVMALLDAAPCDVALLVAGGPLGDGPVLVPFSGAEHDWAAVELAAGLAQSLGRPLRLAGASTGAGGRDASRLLANASLAMQRVLGIDAEPVIVEPSPSALARLAHEAGIVVVGLTERWRHEGLGRARTELATSALVPTLLVRRGLRPGALAPADSDSRFTWTLAAGVA